jgi:hypothetical protein
VLLELQLVVALAMQAVMVVLAEQVLFQVH